MARYSAVIRKVPPDLVLAAVDLWLGATFVVQSKERMPRNGVYLIATDLMSMRVWGALFAIVGAAVLYMSYLHHRRAGWVEMGMARTAIAWIQIGGPALFVAWATMAFISALVSEKASFSVAALYAFLAYRHTFAPDLPDAGNRTDSGAPWQRMN